MAKPTRRPTTPPPSPRASADPARAALQRISTLIARGFDASRLTREAADVLSGWATTMEADDLRELLDEVHGQLAEGVEAAEDAGSEIEADDAASTRAHRRSVSALVAARDAFGLAVQRL